MKETLGSGAYSVVYACVDKQTNERYAVKCIKKKDLLPSDIESLKNEVFIMGRVGVSLMMMMNSSIIRILCVWKVFMMIRIIIILLLS